MAPLDEQRVVGRRKRLILLLFFCENINGFALMLLKMQSCLLWSDSTKPWLFVFTPLCAVCFLELLNGSFS